MRSCVGQQSVHSHDWVYWLYMTKNTFFLFFINDISAREGKYKQTGTDKNVDFKFLLDFIATDQKK